MDVIIDEMESRVDVVDNASLLSPDAMERLIREVLSRLREANRHDAKVREERGLIVPPSHREGL